MSRPTTDEIVIDVLENIKTEIVFARLEAAEAAKTQAIVLVEIRDLLEELNRTADAIRGKV